MKQHIRFIHYELTVALNRTKDPDDCIHHVTNRDQGDEELYLYHPNQTYSYMRQCLGLFQLSVFVEANHNCKCDRHSHAQQN